MFINRSVLFTNLLPRYLLAMCNSYAYLLMYFINLLLVMSNTNSFIHHLLIHFTIYSTYLSIILLAYLVIKGDI